MGRSWAFMLLWTRSIWGTSYLHELSGLSTEPWSRPDLFPGADIATFARLVHAADNATAANKIYDAKENETARKAWIKWTHQQLSKWAFNNTVEHWLCSDCHWSLSAAVRQGNQRQVSLQVLRRV